MAGVAWTRPRSAVAPGLGAIALGSVLFGSSGVLILLCYEHGANAAGILTIRGLATLPWLALLIRAGHRTATRSAPGWTRAERRVPPTTGSPST